MASPLDIYNTVEAAGRRGREQFVNRQVGMLAGRAFGASPQEQDTAVREAYALNRDAGDELQRQLAADSDRRRLQIYNIATGLKRAHGQNPVIAKQLYERDFAPGLQRMGFDVPAQFDEASIMPVVDQVLAVYQPAGAGSVQSTQRLANGNIGIVTRTGQVIDTGQRAAQTTQLVNQEGQVPYLVTTGGGGAGETIAIGGGLGAAAAPSAPALSVSGTGAGGSVDGMPDTGGPARVAIEGVTPEQNASIGRAVDALRAAGIPDDQIDAFVASRQARAPAAAEPSPRAPAPIPVRNPTAAETARATQDAKNASDLANYDAATAALVDRETRVTGAKRAAEQGADVSAKEGQRSRDAQEILGLLDEAEQLLPNATGSTAGAAADRAAAAFGYSTPGAQATAQLNLIASRLTQKVPRFEGPQSNIDVQSYREAAGDLANPNHPVQTRLAALKQMRSLNQKYANPPQASAPRAPAATSTAVPRAKNPRTGEVIEFRNGQWGPAR